MWNDTEKVRNFEMTFDFGLNLRITVPTTNNYNNIGHCIFSGVKKTQNWYKYLYGEMGLSLQNPFTFSAWQSLVTWVKSSAIHIQEEMRGLHLAVGPLGTILEFCPPQHLNSHIWLYVHLFLFEYYRLISLQRKMRSFVLLLPLTSPIWITVIIFNPARFPSCVLQPQHCSCLLWTPTQVYVKWNSCLPMLHQFFPASVFLTLIS